MGLKLGKLLKKAAPFAGAILGNALLPGIGGAALGSIAGNAVKRGKLTLKNAIGDAAMGAAMGGLAGKLGLGGKNPFAKIPGLDQADEHISSVVRGAIGQPGASAATSAVGSIAAKAAPSIGSRIVNGLTDGKTLQGLGAAASGVANYQQASKANALQERRLKMEEEELERRRRMEEENQMALDPSRSIILEALLRRLGLSA